MIETWRTDRFLSYMICDNSIFILLLSVADGIICLEIYGTTAVSDYISYSVFRIGEKIRKE